MVADFIYGNPQKVTVIHYRGQIDFGEIVLRDLWGVDIYTCYPTGYIRIQDSYFPDGRLSYTDTFPDGKVKPIVRSLKHPGGHVDMFDEKGNWTSLWYHMFIDRDTENES